MLILARVIPIALTRDCNSHRYIIRAVRSLTRYDNESVSREQKQFRAEILQSFEIPPRAIQIV